MITERHRNNLKDMHRMYSAQIMFETIEYYLANHENDTDFTKNEVVNAYLDIAQVPANMTLKERLCYYQLFASENTHGG